MRNGNANFVWSQSSSITGPTTVARCSSAASRRLARQVGPAGKPSSSIVQIQSAPSTMASMTARANPPAPPRFLWDATWRTSGNFATTFAVPGLLPLSTTITQSGRRVCDRTLLSAFSRHSGRSWVTTTQTIRSLRDTARLFLDVRCGRWCIALFRAQALPPFGLVDLKIFPPELFTRPVRDRIAVALPNIRVREEQPDRVTKCRRSDAEEAVPVAPSYLQIGLVRIIEHDHVMTRDVPPVGISG